MTSRKRTLPAATGHPPPVPQCWALRPGAGADFAGTHLGPIVQKALAMVEYRQATMALLPSVSAAIAISCWGGKGKEVSEMEP